MTVCPVISPTRCRLTSPIDWSCYPMPKEHQVSEGKAELLRQCLSQVSMLGMVLNLRLCSCRINVKLGGINCIPDPRSVSFLTEPQNPTIVMGKSPRHDPCTLSSLILGCDIIHPAPSVFSPSRSIPCSDVVIPADRKAVRPSLLWLRMSTPTARSISPHRVFRRLDKRWLRICRVWQR